MMYIKLVYLAVFLLVGAAIFLVGGLDEKIAEELRRGKKAGEIKLSGQTVFTMSPTPRQDAALCGSATPLSPLSVVLAPIQNSIG